jgi:flagellar basal body-associated protein FliL
MEMIFVFTHLVMIICSVGIIYMSVGSKDEKAEKKSVVTAAENPKPMHVATTFYQVVNNNI